MVQPFHELLAINLQVHAWYLETLVESLQSNFQSDWKFAWNFACKLSRVDWNFACKLSRVDCKFACQLAGVPWKFAVKLSILIFITIKKINKVWKFVLKLSMHHWKFACKLSTLHWKSACKLAIYPWKFACKVAGKLSTRLKVWLQTFNQSFNIMLMFLWFLSQKHKFSKKKNEWNNHTMVKKTWIWPMNELKHVSHCNLSHSSRHFFPGRMKHLAGFKRIVTLNQLTMKVVVILMPKQP